MLAAPLAEQIDQDESLPNEIPPVVADSDTTAIAGTGRQEPPQSLSTMASSNPLGFIFLSILLAKFILDNILPFFALVLHVYLSESVIAVRVCCLLKI